MSIQRLDEIRMVDPVLTTLTQGYSNNKLVAGSIFPTINVKDSKGKYPIFGKEAFIERETERALRAKSNRINPNAFTMDEYETTEKDIETAIDYIEAEEAHNYYKYEQKICKDLRDILDLNKEKEIAEYLQDENNYSSDMRTIIADNAGIDSIENPIDIYAIISSAKEKVRLNIAKYPNTLVMGISVYNALRNSSNLTGLFNNDNHVLTYDNLKEFFGVDTIVVAESVYSNDGITMTDIWANNMILLYVDRSESEYKSEYNPSFGYLFQRDGMPEIDTYTENGGKIKVVRCTDNYCWKITAPKAGFLIKNVN